MSDGYRNAQDYAVLVSVLRGPICDCAADSDCNDSYPCTIDDCYAGACLHAVTCPNQNDNDADCIHEYGTIAGCVADEESNCCETANDQVMEKVDARGNVLGFSILLVSALKEKPLEVALT